MLSVPLEIVSFPPALAFLFIKVNVKTTTTAANLILVYISL
jgi:hypothetical protein